jgi:D-glycerate 3-kinase
MSDLNSASLSAQPPSAALLLSAISEQPFSTSNRQLLAANLLRSAWQVEAFQITPDTVEAVLTERLEQMRQVHPVVQKFCQQQLGWAGSITTLWQLWLPFANQLSSWQKTLHRPLVQGILGGQGTGKTTLTLILTEILRHFGLQTCRLSIDDLYKTYADRQQLQQVDPRFRWRGPPGTHDVELGLKTLSQLRQGEHPVAIPRFDKALHDGAGDRTEPEWVTGADIILFEGWFVGVRPVAPQVLATAPAPIATDTDRDFAREVNRRLQDYLPLWDQLDRLLVLYPSDYRLSQQWRQQAEQQMIASGRTGMSDAEIAEFVEYFWRALHPELFIQPLLTDAEHVDLVIDIDANHQPGRIYRPGSKQM